MHSSLELPEGAEFGVVLDATEFYAESGGQIFGTNCLIFKDPAEMEVANVQSYGGYVLHTGSLTYGSLLVNDKVLAQIDEIRRISVHLTHTRTHIPNFALREVLGGGIEQKGSFVVPEKLRFDFSHQVSIEDQEIQQIENIVNTYITKGLTVFTAGVPLAIARQIIGVRALFGETYPDPVRIVSIGIHNAQFLADDAAL